MKMIAFYNNKGGVGKTSTAINIAYTLSRRQNRILLVDFDGQCNSSRFFTDLANDECGCESAIVNAEEMPLIKSTRYDNIDIVTSSVRMNSISNDFANFITNEFNMKKQREQLLDNNDKRWAQAIDDLASYKNILKEKTQLIADLYQEKYELKEANLELKKVVRKQARQIDELNAKLYPDTKSNSQKDDMYPTL